MRDERGVMNLQKRILMFQIRFDSETRFDKYPLQLNGSINHAVSNMDLKSFVKDPGVQSFVWSVHRYSMVYAMHD